MNFDKIINDMQSLQTKVADYEKKYKYFEDVILSINKDIVKLEKKKENSKDEIDKHILSIKILLMKDIINRFNINTIETKEI